MRLDRLTEKAQEAIQAAVEQAGGRDQRAVEPEHLLLAALTGLIVSGDRAGALELWKEHAAQLGRKEEQPVFRLLRCHAEPVGGSCAEAFSAYSLR